MFKKLVAAFAALLAATAFAAVDANKATQAELEAISGIGPVISADIVSERKKGDFKDWNDLVVRIKGVGDKSATKFSEGGLTVNGKAYPGAPAAPAKATTAKAAAPDKSGVAKAESAVKGSPKTVTDNVKEEAAAAKQSVADSKAKSAEKKTAAPDKSGVDKAASSVKGSPKTVTDNAKEEAHAAKQSVDDAKAKSAEKKAAKAEAKAEKAAAASAAKPAASTPKK